MDVPSELRWVGPLFAILYSIFWGTRAFAPLLAIFGLALFVFAVSVILVPIIIIIAFFASKTRFRYAILILCISFFFSGISIEPIPIPYPEPYPYPYPPYSPAPRFMYNLSPIFIVLLFISSSGYLHIPEIVLGGFLLLIVMAILSAIIMALATECRIDAVRAMISFVSLIVCWTFIPVFLYPYLDPYIFMTPVPLGPLIALNLLPRTPVLKSESRKVLSS